MDELKIQVGFPEMWQPVHDKYKPFFACADQLQPIINEMIKVPLHDELRQITGRMATAAFNSMGALILLVLNGYGHDAMKIARSLFEIDLNITRLKAHPEDITDFVEYSFIRQKHLYDMMDDEQRATIPKVRHEQMMRDYKRVLPRFATKHDPSVPRNRWCKFTIFQLAEQAGPDSLMMYRTFYSQASSVHHLDIGGVIAHTDSDMQADVAPSWKLLEESLLAMASVISCALLFDEIAGLGFHDRIKSGPERVLIAALNSITTTSSNTGSGTDPSPT